MYACNNISLKYSATQELSGSADSCFLIAMHDKAIQFIQYVAVSFSEPRHSSNILANTMICGWIDIVLAKICPIL